MKKLIIIDEYFVNKGGHYYEYNKSVQEIFEGHHIDTTIYANEKLKETIQQELHAIPTFKGLPKNVLNKIPLLGQLFNRFRFSVSLYKRLRKLYLQEDNREAVFFFTTVVWYNVLPVALAAAKGKQKSALLYRFPVSELVTLPKSLDKAGAWLYRFAFKKLRHNRNIRFFTDSDVIAEECNTKFNCNMKVLPIPHINDAHQEQTNNTLAEPGSFTIYAPGGIRKEKGIEFLTRAFEYMHTVKHPLLSRITLVTQYNETGYEALNKEIKQRLQPLAVRNIFLGNLSTEAYNQQLSDAHIIVITYDIKQGYKARTSGILTETIAACKPFITTKDSWMGIQALKYDTGLSVAYDAPEKFAEALSTLVHNYALYEARALKAKTAWLSFHSKQNFYRIFMAGIV